MFLFQRKVARSKLSIAKEIKEVNRLRLTNEKRMTTRLISLFRKAGRQAANAFERGESINAATQNLDGEVYAVLSAQAANVVEAFAKRVNSNYKNDPTFSSLVNQFLRIHGAQKIAQDISATTRKQIQKAVIDGSDEGLGVSATSKLIRERTSGVIGRSRAATIARTETHAAASYATDEATRQLGLPNQRKRWVAVGDGRTRSHHAAANGQEVGIDEPFLIRYKGSNIQMSYPHDGSGGAANNINCRCLAIYFTEEDELFDDLDLELVDLGIDPSNEDREQNLEKPIVQLIDISALITFLKSPSGKAKWNNRINERTNDQQKAIINNYRKPSQIRKRKGKYFHQREILDTTLDHDMFEHEYGHHIDAVTAKKGFFFRSGTDKDFQLAFVQDAERNGFGKRGIDVTRGDYNVVGYQIDEGFKKDFDELKALLFERVEKTFKRNRRQRIKISNEPKFLGANSISDIVDAMTKGYFYAAGAWGHGVNYYKRDRSIFYETFANLFAIRGNEKAWAIATEKFPNLCREFDRMLDEIEKEKQ
jgi:hypothetical protein